MKRNVAPALGLALVVALGAASCSPQPESSGTNTNWLKACENSAQCGAAGSCVCGLCSASCESEADCGPGTCGTELATAFQCQSRGPQRICLPDAGSETCTEFSIPVDNDLADAPEPGCEVPGALLCESFDAPFPERDATWYSGGMTAAISDCRVHQGAAAIHYRTQAFGYSQTRMRLPQNVASGLLAARFYVYVPSHTTVPDYLGLFELWDEDTGASGKISVEAKPNDVLEVQVSPDGAVHRSAEGALLRDQWQCIALTLNLAAPNGSIALSVNGSSVIEQPAAVTLLPKPISVAVIEGLPSTDATDIDVTMDDLVVASQALACP